MARVIRRPNESAAAYEARACAMVAAFGQGYEETRAAELAADEREAARRETIRQNLVRLGDQMERAIEADCPWSPKEALDLIRAVAAVF